MKKTIAVLVIAMGMVVLGVGQIKGDVRPTLQYTGGATTNSVPLRLTAGTQATGNGFTVYWWDLNHHPAGSSVFVVSTGSTCRRNILQPGQFLDFVIGPIVNSVCQFYPENTEGLATCSTYQFCVELNDSGVRSNNVFQSTICP